MYNLNRVNRRFQPRKHCGYVLLVRNDKHYKTNKPRFKAAPVDLFPSRELALEYGRKNYPNYPIRAEGVRVDMSEIAPLERKE